MPLSADDTARLVKLRAARDALITGQATAEIEYDGVRTKLTQGNAQTILDEINRLEALQSSRGRGRGALRFSI